jgi:hypothetical protein
MTFATTRHRTALLVASFVVQSAIASAAGDPLNFVSCPIVRDTSSVPCWLAEYEGELYFLTIQSDVSAPVTPPWLGHRVLVEGVISAEPRICGGVVLKPVHLSVLPEQDAACNVMLPAESKYDLTFEPPRPPGPSAGRLAFDAVGAASSPSPLPSPVPAPATGVREFVIRYDFDGLVGFSHARVLTDILDYARAVNAGEIEITGYRGAVRLSNGQTMIEDGAMARRRADQVAMLLRGANLTKPTYTVRSQDDTARATGTDDYLTRRVVVIVRPR